jgi:hypothetical protein
MNLDAAHATTKLATPVVPREDVLTKLSILI